MSPISRIYVITLWICQKNTPLRLDPPRMPLFAFATVRMLPSFSVWDGWKLGWTGWKYLPTDSKTFLHLCTHQIKWCQHSGHLQVCIATYKASCENRKVSSEEVEGFLWESEGFLRRSGRLLVRIGRFPLKKWKASCEEHWVCINISFRNKVQLCLLLFRSIILVFQSCVSYSGNVAQ